MTPTSKIWWTYRKKSAFRYSTKERVAEERQRIVDSTKRQFTDQISLSLLLCSTFPVGLYVSMLFFVFALFTNFNCQQLLDSRTDVSH